jgi:hypothetical protein
LKEGDKVKKYIWGIDPHGKDYLYQWKFLPFGLKHAPAKFQRVMDQFWQVLVLPNVIVMTSLFLA